MESPHSAQQEPLRNVSTLPRSSPLPPLRVWASNIQIHPPITSSTLSTPMRRPSVAATTTITTQHEKKSVPNRRRWSHRLSIERLTPRDPATSTNTSTATTTTSDLDRDDDAPTLMKGLLVLLTVLRHVVVSVAVAWLATFCTSLGDFPSRKSTADQPYARFVLFGMLWNHWFFSSFVLIIQALMLVKKHFRSHRNPNRGASMGFCCWRLVRATWPHFAFTLVLLFGIYKLGIHFPVVGVYHLEFYLGCTVGLIYMVSVVVATRRIYKSETIEGQERALQQGRPHTTANRRSGRSGVSSVRAYLRAFLECSPRSLTVMGAGLYVQISSPANVTRQQDLVYFAIGSLCAKLTLQELAKWYMVRQNVTDIRSMYGIVALPTVLIDTQVRLVLQRLQSSQSTLSGICLMAAVELALRLGKVAMLKVGLYRQRQRVQEVSRRVSVGDHVAPGTEQALLAAGGGRVAAIRSFGTGQMARITRTTTFATLVDFERHEKRLLRFHAAESYADMAAEYIAIGCSSAILFFFSDHQKYQLATIDTFSSSSGSDSGSVAMAVTSAGDKALQLGVQLGLELVVDFVCCVLEIHGKVDFQDLHRHVAYLGAVLLCIGVLNVQISAFIYLKPPSG